MSDPSREDTFEYWLMDMDDALERFVDMLPQDVRGRLDYSAGSLDVVEAWLLDRYAGVEQARQPAEAPVLDGAARYVGETYRKALGGAWTIDFSDEKNAFFGVPQLVGCRNQVTQICPLKMVTASLARRTGTFTRIGIERHL